MIKGNSGFCFSKSLPLVSLICLAGAFFTGCVHPVSKYFEDVAAIPGGTASESSIVGLKDGRILITHTGKASEQASIFDPIHKKIYTVAGKMNCPGDGYNSLTLQDGRVLIIGNSRLSTLRDFCSQVAAEIFDPSSEKFTSIVAPQAKTWQSSLTLLKSGKVLIVGGFHADNSKADSRSILIFDPQTDQFRFIGKLKIPKVEHSVLLLNDHQLIVIGGEQVSFNNSMSYEERDNQSKQIELYDINKNTSRIIGKLNYVRIGYPAVTLLKDNRILIAGGHDRLSYATNKIELFDPHTGQVAMAGELKNAKSDPGSALLPDGRVLLIGGWGDGTRKEQIESTHWVELFDPVAMYIKPIDRLPFSFNKTGFLSGNNMLFQSKENIYLISENYILKFNYQKFISSYSSK